MQLQAEQRYPGIPQEQNHEGERDVGVRYVMTALILITLLAPACIRAVERGDDATAYYTTRPGDTLGEIARRYLQDEAMASYHPAQIMLALFQANPEAFIDDNINNLKAGYVLRLPARENIPALGVEDAVAWVSAQHARWRQAGAQPTTPAPPPLEASTTAPQAAAEPAADDSPDTPDTESESDATGPVAPSASTDPAGAPFAQTTELEDTGASHVAADQAVTRLQRDLALAQAQATQRHLESEVLQARVAALEERLAQLNDRLAQPQAAAERQQGSDAARPPETGQADTNSDVAAVTQPSPTSRSATRVAIALVVMAVSAAVLLGLIGLWFMQRHPRGRRVEPITDTVAQPRVAAPTTAADDMRSVGVGDLALPTEASRRATPDAGTTGRADLIIDLDDLELDPDQDGASSGRFNTASMSRKAASAPE